MSDGLSAAYAAHEAAERAREERAREDMRRRILTDPVAHAVAEIVRRAIESPDERNVVLDATAAILSVTAGGAR